MKRVVLTLAALAVLGGLAGGAIVLGGLYNVSARAGHWPITTWVLHTTFRNSVELRAPDAEEVPDLRAEGMAALGAKHYLTACAPCHAAPGEDRWAIARAMEPPPPHVTEAVDQWAPQHLFWILREGVKMSGMPHWTAAREDDIWPVVAFLDRAAGMSAQDYARLTAPPAEQDDRTPEGPRPEGLEYCARCHGTTGQSGNPQIPRLDIQDTPYLLSSLLAYAEGRRASGVMSVAASRFDPAQLAELAEWYGNAASGGARLRPSPLAASETAAPRAEVLARGEALARGTAYSRDVPACTACHGPSPSRRAADHPRLAGQSASYLSAQLHLWRDGARGGGARAHLMRHAARDLSDDDIEALAQWYARQAPGKTDGTQADATR